MLVRRIGEINAIVRLKEVSRTDEFKGALAKAAKSPAPAARQIVTDPVNAITNAPKVSKASAKHQDNDPEGSQLQQIIGFSDTKRKVAMSLGG
jgi:hypothetical protein